MNKKFTTVLFVSNDNHETKSFNIPTKHVQRFRLYAKIASASIIAFALITLSLFLGLIISQNNNSKLHSKIVSLEKDVEVMDSLHIKNKINNIEQRIFNINNFLREKGISTDTSGIGGEYNPERVDYTVYDFYDKHTDFILSNIQEIPLGYPYIGEVSSEYGNRTNPFGGRSFEFHSGIDFKGEIGDKVECTADGVVELADYHNGYGKCVIIRHKHSYSSLYGHLSEINVTTGQNVKAGDIIGYVGNTGRSTGPHLHYEIRKNGTDINPNDFLNLN
ncbi:MAG: M23 family metallopeptidase [Ignavibacteria bacterium]|nr:M23 family metallopeptidase [Ignavibacteria bacterium]